MTSVWKRICGGCVMLVLASAMAAVCALPAQARLGQEITNIATVSQDSPSGRLQVETNPATFTIEARPTPSQIDFFRFAPGAPDALMVSLNGADYSPSGALDGPFSPLSPAPALSVAASASAPVALVAAERYMAGEIIIVRVIDRGQNGDPGEIETVVARVTTPAGDTITLRLYESGPDTGEFFAWFESAAEATPANDTRLSAPQNTALTATYVDVFDATEVSIDTALVDPFGLVFDSFTGALVSGARVTIIEVSTGQPAEVYGLDGVSAYPSSVVTGSSVTDASGRGYALGPGEFLFPLMRPGQYQLVVDAPEGYLFASVRSPAEIATLAAGPFEIVDGSYGAAFTVTATGPLNLDVPVDPNGDLVVRKEATDTTASVGDFVGYTVELQNAGQVPAPFRLRDTLPPGLRYVAGSARLDGVEIADPLIAPDGRELTFGGGLVTPQEARRLSYMTSVGPGTPLGEAVNRAVALNTSGAQMSNIAEAGIRIEEDLLSSKLTIIGRVAEAACRPDADWARALEDGIGVAGVRLYMETGRYVVTDEDGLFHFEGIKPGTHVVQVDAATLPDGYEPVICEENSRYAGSALSKFVDAQGGMVWRANFYLQRTDTGDARSSPEMPADTASVLFDEAWLDAQASATPRWAYPDEGATPDGRSVNLGLLHGGTQSVSLRLNGQPVSGLNFTGILRSSDRAVALSRWSGVDIQRGANLFEADIHDQQGRLVAQLEKTVWFVDEVHRAALVSDQTDPVADGRTRPVIAVRLEDAGGHPVHEGRLVEIAVDAPYRLAEAARQEIERPVSAALSTVTTTRVGPGGIALVELEPTLKAGRARVQVSLHDRRVEDIDVWLQPEKRDWVVVGLAEAEGLLADVDGQGGRDIEETMSDGRLAFYAKGVVRGDWLLTVAVDTAKRRGRQDGELFDEIDPDAYYTLYGDRTYQANDAESRYPVYVKLERDTFQALFGDFVTDLTDTELGRYARRLSGVKADYESETVSLTAFASQTNQRFTKEEIAADGTSGPFRLQGAPLVRSSEAITVETRDRFRPDQTVSVRPLARYIDYEIDYTTGELFFRHPVSASDDGFNTNVIVVDYETSAAGRRGLTAGGRGALRFAGGDVETGLTVLHEAASGDATGRSELLAADTTIRLGETSELRAEIAASRSNTGDRRVSGNAWLVEATRTSGRLNATGYYREETQGFGLGQQASTTSALRRIGAQLSAELSVTEVADGADRSERRLEAQAYREHNLGDDTRRDVADVTLRQDSQAFGASIGMRAVAEDFSARAEPRQSMLLTASVRKTFIDQGLTLTAAHEEPVWGGGRNDDEASLFPGRTIVGLDKTLGRRATLTLRHEVTNGANASGDNTVAGINWTPINGTQLRAATDMVTQDSARRIGATVGVDQTWQIDDHWSVSFGLAHRTSIDGGDAPRDIAPDAAIGIFEEGVRSPLVESEAYTSGYVGGAYRAAKTAASARLEVRDSTSGKRTLASFGGAREVSQVLSFSAAARHLDEQVSEGDDRERLDIRVAAAWRPRGEGMVVFNRIDIGRENIAGQVDKTKLVNNLAINTMLDDRTQLSVYHGLKYVEAELNGARADGVTNLAGAELRHDISRKVDIGLQAFWTRGEASHTSHWALGPSLGFTPQKNVWISVGWNFSGFADEDFEAAEYTRSGAYVKLRAKFDQDTLRGLIDRLGLGAGG